MLLPLKKNFTIRPFLTFDIEAERWSEFRLCGVYDGKAYRRFAELGKAMEFFLTQKNKDKIFFAHVLSYDGMFVLDYLLRRKDLITRPILNGSRLLSIGVKDKYNHRWNFRDSYSLLPNSLKNLTKDFDTRHKKLDEGEKGMLSNPEYNKNDTIGLYEVLTKFFETLDGKAGLTISQTAVRNYREQFQKYPIQSVEKHEDKIRSAYYGGRCEIFSFNLDADKKFYYYDINSLYPFCLTKEYPYGKFHYCQPDIDKFGFTYGEIVEEEQYIPLLPERIDKKMFFRQGHKQGWYSNQEFQHLEELDIQTKPIVSLVCEDYDFIFRDFIESWYEKRLAAKEANNVSLAYVCKLIMNSFYGKFAQERSKMVTIINPIRLRDGMIPISIGDCRIYQTKELSKANHIIPSISALTTAYARVHMHKKMLAYGKGLYYTDTDSLIGDRKVWSDSRELGKPKLEAEITAFFPVLPKIYYFIENGHQHIKMKGVPIDSRQPAKEQKRLLLQYLKGHSIENNRGLFSMKRAIIAARKTDIASLLFRKEISRTLKSYYDKRKIENDLSCSPFLDTEDRTINRQPFEKIRQKVIRLIENVQTMETLA